MVLLSLSRLQATVAVRLSVACTVLGSEPQHAALGTYTAEVLGDLVQAGVRSFGRVTQSVA
jgi:hypothetical protein